VKSDKVNNDKIIIDTDDVNHIKNVLRKNIGDMILVCDYEKKINYNCKIEEIGKKEIVCKIEEQKESESESNIRIDIFQGLPKADKMELIIQKGTELGVNSFIPVEFKRSVVKIDSKDEDKKQARWQKIAEVAAKQSGRDMIPLIKRKENVKNICKLFGNYDIVLVAYEAENKNGLKEVLNSLKDEKWTPMVSATYGSREITESESSGAHRDPISIAVVIGPEGGIEEQEIEEFKQAGAKIVTLGKRILRTETVCLAMTAIINYELERTEEK